MKTGKIVKKLALGLVAFITLLFLAFYISVSLYVRNSPLTADDWKFSIPAEVTLINWTYAKESYSLAGDRLSIRWRWWPLLLGKLEVDNVVAQGLDVHVENSGSPDTDDSDTTYTSWPISVRRCLIQNANITYLNGSDSLVAEIKSLLSTGLKVNRNIEIDSLLLHGKTVRYLANNSRVAAPAVQSPGEVISFHINHVNVYNDSLIFSQEAHDYKISRLQIELQNIESGNLVQSTLNHISFVYQDSIEVNSSLRSIQLRGSNKIMADSFQLKLPGIDFNVDQLAFQSGEQRRAHIRLDESHISVNLLKWIVPEIGLPLTANSIISFNGELRLLGDQLIIETFALKLQKETELAFQGYVNWSEQHDTVSLQVSHLVTTSADLKDFLPSDLDGTLKPFKLEMTGSIYGKLSNLYFKSHSSIHGTTISVNGRYVHRDDQRTLSLTGFADAIRVTDFLREETWNVRSKGISFVANTTIDKSGRIKNPGVSLSMKNLTYEQYSLENIKLQYSGIHNTENILIESNAFHLALTVKNRHDSLATMEGKTIITLPDLGGNKNTLALCSDLLGSFAVNGSSGFKVKLFTKNAQLTSSDSKHAYTFPNAEFMFAMRDEYLSSYFRNDQYEMMNFTGSTDITSIIDAFQQEGLVMPQFELSLNMSVDSTLMQLLTGTPGELHRSGLVAHSIDDSVSLSLNIPMLRYSGLEISQLTSKTLYHDSLVDATLLMNELKHPLIALSDASMSVHTARNGYAVNLRSDLADYGIATDLYARVERLSSGWHVTFPEDKKLLLAGSLWTTIDKGGVSLTDNLEIANANIGFKSDDQIIALHSNGHKFKFEVNSLDLAPFSELLLNPEDSVDFSGRMNFMGNFATPFDSLDWKASLTNFAFGKVLIGNVANTGYYTGNSLTTFTDINGKSLKGNMTIKKTDIIHFDGELREYDLDLLTNSSFLPKGIELTGTVFGKVKGTYAKDLSMDGFLSIRHADVMIPKQGLHYRVPSDSVYFGRDRIDLKRISLIDDQGHAAELRGRVILSGTPRLDLSMTSDNVIILNTTNSEQLFSGFLQLSSDLKIAGSPKDIAIGGKVNVTPGGNFRYNFFGSSELFESGSVVKFVVFDSVTEARSQTLSINNGGSINWNVDLKLGRTDVTVMLYETTQEYIKMNLVGDLQLRSGNSDSPNVFGSLHTEGGRAIFDPPMITRLDMNIEKAKVTWEGYFAQPVIYFKGIETIRAPVKDLSSSFDNRSDRAPFNVALIVNEKRLTDLDLQFDLSSPDGEVNTYLQSTTPDTRSAYAINLLIFGGFKTSFESGGSPYLRGAVNKLNEISRRNLKNTDLSFGVDSYANDSFQDIGSSYSDLNYNLSKGIANNKIRINVGGDIGINQSKSTNHKSSSLLGKIIIDYVVKEKPYFAIRAKRANEYKGVIDGQVTESSLGFTLQRTFPYLFQERKLKKKK